MSGLAECAGVVRHADSSALDADRLSWRASRRGL